jgi:hypothetical protein
LDSFQSVVLVFGRLNPDHLGDQPEDGALLSVGAEPDPVEEIKRGRVRDPAIDGAPGAVPRIARQ